MSTHDLLLYYSATCPYCKRVLDYLVSAGQSIPMKEIEEDPGAGDALYELTNRLRVPCLVIDGNPMYESLDIIEWLKENLNGN